MDRAEISRGDVVCIRVWGTWGDWRCDDYVVADLGVLVYVEQYIYIFGVGGGEFLYFCGLLLSVTWAMWFMNRGWVSQIINRGESCMLAHILRDCVGVRSLLGACHVETVKSVDIVNAWVYTEGSSWGVFEEACMSYVLVGSIVAKEVIDERE